MRIFQFDVWQVNLNPTKGSEQKGKRPCVIMQTNAVSDYGLTTIIAPLTSKNTDRVYSFEAIIKPSRQNGLKEMSKIKINQVRVIDKSRLINKLGRIEKGYYHDIQIALKVIFDFNEDFI